MADQDDLVEWISLVRKKGGCPLAVTIPSGIWAQFVYRVEASEQEVDDMLAAAIQRLGLDEGASEVTEVIQRLDLEGRDEDGNGEKPMDIDSD